MVECQDAVRAELATQFSDSIGSVHELETSGKVKLSIKYFFGGMKH